MSKCKAFKVFCSKVKPISSAYPYLCGSNSNSLMPGVKAVTGRWSYPRSYAQVVKNNCKVDCKTSISEVKGYESVVDDNSCKSSGNRLTRVVNKDAGFLTPQRSCVQVIDRSANTLNNMTPKASRVQAIHHNCPNKATARIVVDSDHESGSTLSCQKSAENSGSKVVQPQEAKVIFSESSYSTSESSNP